MRHVVGERLLLSTNRHRGEVTHLHRRARVQAGRIAGLLVAPVDGEAASVLRHLQHDIERTIILCGQVAHRPFVDEADLIAPAGVGHATVKILCGEWAVKGVVCLFLGASSKPGRQHGCGVWQVKTVGWRGARGHEVRHVSRHAQALGAAHPHRLVPAGLGKVPESRLGVQHLLSCHQLQRVVDSARVWRLKARVFQCHVHPLAAVSVQTSVEDGGQEVMFLPAGALELDRLPELSHDRAMQAPLRRRDAARVAGRNLSRKNVCRVCRPHCRRFVLADGLQRTCDT